MRKNFQKWHKQKTTIDESIGKALFQEREVWWCALGINVGSEQDGGKNFERPVVIIKKFNLDACLVIPLTGRSKRGKYYFSVGLIKGRNAVAILSQLRFIDRKRLANKICTLDEGVFRKLVASIVRASLL
ncbi:MAG: type II toxin-antitoxin system PemK/MazF family toxin [Patescibacteria group bacterium]